MAEKRRFLDVWIVETNTVYKEVPFDVVSDWVQQGRLLEDDQVKPSGTKDWMRLGDNRELVPYLPRPEPMKVDDPAEALEAVELDFHYKRPHDGEEDDPDMIPLIDVSLVLLIFFMLTASSAMLVSYVSTPEADHGLMADSPQSFRIDISLGDGDQPLFALGRGDAPAAAEDSNLIAIPELLDKLREKLAEDKGGPFEMVINADKDLKSKVARELLVALREEPFRTRLSVNYYGVSEREDR